MTALPALLFDLAARVDMGTVRRSLEIMAAAETGRASAWSQWRALCQETAPVEVADYRDLLNERYAG